jgi:hypothetical protein
MSASIDNMVAFIDILRGYYSFIQGSHHIFGCDTNEIAMRFVLAPIDEEAPKHYQCCVEG